jgi:hypothetical protein
MSKPKIAVIVGSTRATRFGDKPAEWIANIAKARGDLDIEIVDLRDYPLPFFDEVSSSLYSPSKSEVAQRWQKKVARLRLYRVEPQADLFRRLRRRRRRPCNRATPAECRGAADGAG